MKKIIQFACLIPFAFILAGCVSSKAYFTDRGRDAKDIVTCSCGVGLGAKVRVAFIQTGLLAHSDIAGLRAGEFFASTHLDPIGSVDDGQSNSYEHEIGLFGVPLGLTTVCIMGLGLPIGDSNTGRDQFRLPGIPHDRGKDVDSRSLFIFVTEDSPQHLSQIEAVVGLFGSVRIGFNPGELLDFILGWTTIDIYNDDLEKRKRIEQVPRDTDKPRL